jgi:hypothetical protein
MVKLHDGREISIDLYKVTRREFSRFGEKDTPEDEENAILAKAAGLKADEIPNLPQPDFDKIVIEFYKTRRDLMANPT